MISLFASRPRTAEYAGIVALSFLGAGLATMSFEPFGWAPLAWLAPVPICWLARRHRDSTTKLVLAGLLSSFFLSVLSFPWLVGTIQRYAETEFASALLVFLATAPFLQLKYTGFIVFFGWSERWRDLRVPTWLRCATIATLADLFTPSLFFWRWGDLFVHDRLILQLAELGGAGLLTFVQFAFAGVLLGFVRAHREARSDRPSPVVQISLQLAWIPLLYATAFGLDRLTASELKNTPTVLVAILQPAAPLERPLRDEQAEEQIDEIVYRVLPALARKLRTTTKVDLIVLGESAIPYYSSDDSPIHERHGLYHSGMRALLTELAQGFRASVFASEVALRYGRTPHDGQTRVEPLNAAVLLDPEGSRRGLYVKNDLLPFGEYVPGEQLVRRLGLHDFLPAALRESRFYPGGRAILIPYSFKKSGAPRKYFAPGICFEILNNGLIREQFQGEMPIDFLVNLTNEGWFDSELEARQHLSLSRVRTVEFRRSLVRATNGGLSALFDPRAQSIGFSPGQRPAFGSPAIVRGAIPVLERTTLYANLGVAWLWLPIAGCLLYAVAAWLTRRHHSQLRRKGLVP